MRTSLAIALLLLACQSYGSRAEAVREAIVGLRARQVINCMGPPEDLDYENQDHAIWVYLRPLVTGAVLTERRMGSPPSGPRRPPQLPPVTIGDPRNPGEGRDADDLDDFGDDEEDYGYCQLSFELEDGLVSGFEAVGRSSQGLNADAACALLAGHCVAPRRAR